MKRSYPLLGPLVLALGLFPLLTMTSDARAGEYTFTRIVDDTEGLRSFGPPALSEAGATAFYAEFGSSDVGIFSGAGGATPTRIAASGPIFRAAHFDAFPTIDAAGNVAFHAVRTTGGAGIYVGDGLSTAELAFTDGPFLLFWQPSINNAGTVAFKAMLDGGASGVYTVDGSTTTNLVTTADGVFQSIGNFVALNDVGAVAFRAQLSGVGGGVFVAASGVTTQIALTGGEIAAIADAALSINASGVVGFQATLTNGATAIFTGDGGSLTKVTDTSSGPFSFLGAPTVLDSGDLVFGAILDNGDLGLFTGLDPLTDRIIGTGDALDGSTVTTLNFWPTGVNNQGSVAFYAELADGRTGLYRADLTSQAVPEPSSLLLLGGGVFGLLSAGRRRRRRAVVENR